MKLERKHALDFALSSSTLSTAQLQLGGSKHLSMPVNLGLSIDFFKFTSMFIRSERSGVRDLPPPCCVLEQDTLLPESTG